MPQLQKYIFDILFNEIANYSAEANQDTSWLHLLLNPLSYLPYIDNPEFITTKLLDILEIASYPAQLEILNSIPEIIPDGQHTKTATELCMTFNLYLITLLFTSYDIFYLCSCYDYFKGIYLIYW